jgi:hypothetical protein
LTLSITVVVSAVARDCDFPDGLRHTAGTPVPLEALYRYNLYELPNRQADPNTSRHFSAVLGLKACGYEIGVTPSYIPRISFVLARLARFSFECSCIEHHHTE